MMRPHTPACIGAKRLRPIAPRCAGSQDPKDAVQDTAVTARLVRQHRLDGRPLVVGEFVAHDSRLQFGHLNHAPGDAINAQRPIVADANTLISLPLSGGLCCKNFFDISTRNKDSI
jgi:hypothetical protein